MAQRGPAWVWVWAHETSPCTPPHRLCLQNGLSASLKRCFCPAWLLFPSLGKERINWEGSREASEGLPPRRRLTIRPRLHVDTCTLPTATAGHGRPRRAMGQAGPQVTRRLQLTLP